MRQVKKKKMEAQRDGALSQGHMSEPESLASACMPMALPWDASG